MSKTNQMTLLENAKGKQICSFLPVKERFKKRGGHFSRHGIPKYGLDGDHGKRTKNPGPVPSANPGQIGDVNGRKETKRPPTDLNVSYSGIMSKKNPLGASATPKGLNQEYGKECVYPMVYGSAYKGEYFNRKQQRAKHPN